MIMNKKIENMNKTELSRWLALLMALDIIEEKCKILNKKFDDVDLKPIALKHYINSLSNKIENDLESIEKRESKKEFNFINKISNLTLT